MAVSNETIDILNYPVCFSQPLRLLHSSGWIEHVPFGMLMIDILRPDVLVELGTHMGVSYCSFCQAVKQLELGTLCYAIDTWKGDSHAGYYGGDILIDLRKHHDALYGDFSRLVENTFDEAVNYFPDHSIDLLHIDGLHTYEAVKHDFETWLPKMTKRGVVMLHDINVREREFGVWKFWLEVRQQYPHFDFNHGHGLGVLYVGEITENPLSSLFSFSKDQATHFRNIFFVLGSRLSYQADKELATSSFSAKLLDKDQIIQTLLAQIEDLKGQTIEFNKIIVNLNDQISNFNQVVGIQDRRIEELNLAIEEQNNQVNTIVNLEGQIAGLHQEISRRDEQLSLHGSQIGQLQELLSSQHQTIQQIYASTSWRLTYPIRALKTLVTDKKDRA